MPNFHPMLLAVPALALLAGCADTSMPPPPSALQSASVQPGIVPPERGTPVVPGQPARVFVMVGFGANCKSTGTPVITIERAPTKGTISYRPGQETTIQFSKKGNCLGRRVTGTGIYYTAREGQTGEDTFSIVGRIGKDEPITQSFTVRIAE